MGRCHIIRQPNPPSTPPTASGDHFVNTSTGETYISAGTSSISDWILVGSAQGDVFLCPSSVSILDVVYVSGPNQVDKAIANDSVKKFSIGIVRAKISPTLARVDSIGKISGFSSLTINQPVFLSDSVLGGITQTPPTGSGKWIQIIGMATDTTDIMLSVQPPITRV